MKVLQFIFIITVGKEWTEVFSRHNSGTYNNQWMIVDYKLFKPFKPLRDGLFWVLEQLPTLIESRDATDVLRSQSFWPSYNSPYFPTIFNLSGVPALVEQYGDWFTYDKTPRALIFNRDQSKITDMNSMIRMVSVCAFYFIWFDLFFGWSSKPLIQILPICLDAVQWLPQRPAFSVWEVRAEIFRRERHLGSKRFESSQRHLPISRAQSPLSRRHRLQGHLASAHDFTWLYRRRWSHLRLAPGLSLERIWFRQHVPHRPSRSMEVRTSSDRVDTLKQEKRWCISSYSQMHTTISISKNTLFPVLSCLPVSFYLRKVHTFPVYFGQWKS